MPDGVLPTEALDRVVVEVHLGPGDRREALRRDVLEGLTRTPKSVPPKWFYDELGSALFGAITLLPEYYLTRREREILELHAENVAWRTPADTLVELGSGTSEKTRLLLDALVDAGKLRCFVPVDVSEETLRDSALRIAREYPDLSIHGVVGDLERHLAHVPAGGRSLFVFLGSSIGNFRPAARMTFLQQLRASMRKGDGFLLGVDLVKDPQRLVAAYDDALGVTAAFNRNMLGVLNRELGADFALERFEHVTRWNGEEEWVELSLRSLDHQLVRLKELTLEVEFAAGEELHTEISAKFRRDRIEGELRRAGLVPAAWWTDAAGDFALSLSHAA